MRIFRDSFDIVIRVKKEGEMGMLKKSLVVILIYSLMLLGTVGCNQETEATIGEVAMGRYIEEEVTIDGFMPEATTFLVSNQGKSQIYQQTEKGFVIFEQQKDGTWGKVEPSWLEAFNNQYAYNWISAMTVNEKGEPYFIMVGDLGEQDPNIASGDMGTKTENSDTGSTEEANLGQAEQSEEGTGLKEEGAVLITNEDGAGEVVNNTYTYAIYAEGDAIKTCRLNITGSLGYIIPSHVVILPNNQLVVSGSATGQRCYDLKTGNEMIKYSEANGNIAQINNKLYTINLTDKQIDAYNENASQVDHFVPCENIDEMSILIPAKNNNMYLVTSNGIRHFAEGGTIWEEIMSSTGLSLGLPSYGLVNAVEQDERFIVQMTNDQYQHVIKQYRYSETTPTLPTTELNAYTLETNKTLQEALTAYQLQHPEVRINVQVGITGEAGITREDAIKALNTAILAGEGPDIIVLDGLPIDTYMEKGVLADLSEIKGKEQIFEFATAPFQKSQQLYALPLRFNVPTIWGDPQVLNEVDNLEELGAYQKAHSKEIILPKQDPEYLMNLFGGQMQEEWFNEQRELQEETLIQFLEMIKIFSRQQEKVSVEYSTMMENNHETINTQDIFEYAFGKSRVFIGDVSRILDLLICNEANKQKGKGSFKILQQKGQRTYKPSSIIGLNASSKDKVITEEILTFMLEEKIQLTDTLEGFPTHVSAFEKWIKGETINKNASYMYSVDDHDILVVEWGHEEALQAFYEEVKQIKTAILDDETLINLITEGSKAYFENKESAKQVVERLKPQLELYSKE